MSKQQSGLELSLGKEAIQQINVESIWFHNVQVDCIKIGQTVFTNLSKIAEAVGLYVSFIYLPIGKAHSWLLNINASLISKRYQPVLSYFKRHFFNFIYTYFFVHTTEQWAKMPTIGFSTERSIS